MVATGFSASSACLSLAGLQVNLSHSHDATQISTCLTSGGVVPAVNCDEPMFASKKQACTYDWMHAYIAKRIVHTPFPLLAPLFGKFKYLVRQQERATRVAQATSKRFTDMEFRYCAFCHDGFWKPTRLGFAIRYICQADLWDREGSCNNYDVMYVDVIVAFWLLTEV